MYFLGTFDYAMDERGRLPLPPRYREEFRAGIVLSQGSPDRCLHVYTWPEFQRQADQYTAESALRRKGRVLRRALFADAYATELDGQNRVLIPAPLREYAGLAGKVLVVATGERLEVWSPEEYEAERARVAEELPTALESIEARDR